MSFSSSLFLVGLLPWLLLLVLIFRRNIVIKKLILVLSSTFFYLYTGIKPFFVVFIIIILSYIFSCINNKYHKKKIILIECLILVFPLVMFKYSAISNNYIPLGISFLTFEALAYVIDTYRKKITDKNSIIDLYLYIMFFPTITSGPIVRFNDFKEYLYKQNNETNVADNLERIIIGVSKKMLVADKLSILVDYYFEGVSNGNSYSWFGLWIGSIAYSLQIYFDFSGYTDIAIGISSIIGIKVPENFNKPYQAKSISEFWKRWHISLTKWFTDYIYIPLGGNRCSKQRHVINLFVVWVITGVWHGNNATFIVWGFAYFILQLLEKYIPMMRKLSEKWYGRLYTLFWVNILWVFFRADNILIATNYIKGMFTFTNPKGLEDKAVYFLPLIIISVILCSSFDRLIEICKDNKLVIIVKGIVIIMLLFLSICAIFNSTYTPYIYGKF